MLYMNSLHSCQHHIPGFPSLQKHLLSSGWHCYNHCLRCLYHVSTSNGMSQTLCVKPLKLLTMLSLSMTSALYSVNMSRPRSISYNFVLFWTIFNEGAYLTFRSIFHKALIYFSSIVISRSNPFLEPTSTKQ